MPILADLADFAAALPREGALFGLDLGTRTLGIAVSDVTRTIATPFALIVRKALARDLAALAELADKREAVGFVLGLPLEMSGAEGERAEASRRFAAQVLTVRDLPVLLWDERLSTAAVERILIGEADLSRARRKQVVDRSAAAFILQGALDRLHRLADPGSGRP